MEKSGCNVNYTSGTVAYSDVVQCLFISQNVCTVLITVLSVCLVIISNAKIILLPSYIYSQIYTTFFPVTFSIIKQTNKNLDIINQCVQHLVER